MKLGGRRVEEGSGEHTNGSYEPSFIFEKETSLSPIAKLLKGDIGDVGGSNLFFFSFQHTPSIVVYLLVAQSNIGDFSPLRRQHN